MTTPATNQVQATCTFKNILLRKCKMEFLGLSAVRVNNAAKGSEKHRTVDPVSIYTKTIQTSM
jgi:hypothetical protein